MAEAFAPGSSYGSIAPTFPNNDVFADPMQLEAPPADVTVFKQNIRLISEHVLHLQNVARSALDGIQNAYHPGSNPVQTESDIATLKQNLEMLSELMRQTGVGALPLLSIENPPPTEEQIMSDVTKSVEVLYARLQRNQESAGVVAKLLSDATGAARKGPGK
ncbi:hypothetical protein CPB85DRAFT_235118 [Mucidula mucida]|nr:hypothetical protein CPB85DRAFT_235118 [Mucidula mucida]